MRTLDACLRKHGPELWLDCPYCGNDNTHQGNVEVYSRGEDSPDGTHVTVTQKPEFGPAHGGRLPCGDGSVKVDRDLSGNPSLRRQGLRLWFWCEFCPHPFSLDISQHKGLTIIGLKDHRR